MIKIGLKENSAFLFEQMKGDTLGGTTGEPYFNSIVHLNKTQFKKFKRLIVVFGGDVDKSLIKTEKGGFLDHVDYECYFKKG